MRFLLPTFVTSTFILVTVVIHVLPVIIPILDTALACNLWEPSQTKHSWQKSDQARSNQTLATKLKLDIHQCKPNSSQVSITRLKLGSDSYWSTYICHHFLLSFFPRFLFLWVKTLFMQICKCIAYMHASIDNDIT